MERETYKSERQSGVIGVVYSDDELCARATTREQKLRAVNTVCAHVPEGPGRNVVLAALFAPSKPLSHRSGGSS